jgi:transposase
LRHALNCLAIVAPEWLLAHSSPEWVERYEARMEDARTPLGEEARHAYAEVIGADGASLLSAVYEAAAPAFLQEIPAVQILRQVWVQNYSWVQGKIRWRSSEDIPPAARYIGSPYDVEAHYSKKRSTTWVGYKVHLTETCEKDEPHLITHVETTSAAVSDDARTALIHEGLKRKGLLPEQHSVDTGYVDAKLLVERKPGLPDRPGGSNAPQSSMASQGACRLRCRSLSHRLGTSTGHLDGRDTPAVVGRLLSTTEPTRSSRLNFRGIDCQACPSLRLCTHSIRHVRRTITIRPKEQYDALQARRQYETTKDFKALYATRAGVEGTISQGVRTMGLRRSRYIGQERTHLQHVAIAAAINIVRLMRWLGGVPHAKTRQSPFAQLHRPAA